MFKIMFISNMFLISTLMLSLKHPLSMGLMILIQTFLICLVSGMLIKTYWFSYTLFLIFLGGLLVLFIYVSSIASNELFKFKFNNFFIAILIMNILFLFIYFFFNQLSWMNFSFNMDMTFFFEKFLMLNNENKMSLIKLYNSKTYLLMLMLIIYLFITLISIIKITNIFFGPLRMMY